MTCTSFELTMFSLDLWDSYTLRIFSKLSEKKLLSLEFLNPKLLDTLTKIDEDFTMLCAIGMFVILILKTLDQYCSVVNVYTSHLKHTRKRYCKVFVLSDSVSPPRHPLILVPPSVSLAVKFNFKLNTLLLIHLRRGMNWQVPINENCILPRHRNTSHMYKNYSSCELNVFSTVCFILCAFA